MGRQSYKQKISKLLGTAEAASFLVDKYGITYKSIHNCVEHGLSIQEVECLLEKREENGGDGPYLPLHDLMRLYLYFEKDETAVQDALDYVNERHDLWVWRYMSYSESEIYTHIRIYFLMDKFLSMVQRHGLGALGVYPDWENNTLKFHHI